MKDELIICFEDTRRISATLQKERKSTVLREISPTWDTALLGDSAVVTESTTFAAAEKYVRKGHKVAVLNFANPVSPGGGVTRGAMAQEECLCRSSDLYEYLIAEDVMREYYRFNSALGNCVITDSVVYSKDVTVFKTDDDVPRMMPSDRWFTVDVITCAAPFAMPGQVVSEEILRREFRNRIINIFEAALKNRAEVIILGAFGCGAFKNPPELVAGVFKEVIEDSFCGCFSDIVFAIKPTRETGCPNITAFRDAFCGDISVLPTPRPSRCSILGDSVSSLEGYNPEGYNVYYTGEMCEKTGVGSYEDTWWGKVIEHFNGSLLVNNSWSGSKVTKINGRRALFPAGCSDERTGGLHRGAELPDDIIVMMGVNDWAYGVPIEGDNEEYFAFAYDVMLKKLKKSYPAAKIHCCTLCETTVSKKPDFRFPGSHKGAGIEEYNSVIRKSAFRNKCGLLDLYMHGRSYDSIDGVHPNAAGMQTIADMIIAEADAPCTAAVVRLMPEASQLERTETVNGSKTWYAKWKNCEDVKITLYEGGFENIGFAEAHRCAEMQMQLQHPGLGRLVGVCVRDDYLCCAQLREKGENLERLLEKYGRFDSRQAAEIGIRICDVLHYLHTRTPPVIHRDVKPSCIVLRDSGDIVITEMSIAKYYDPAAVRDEKPVGTVGYAPPEQYGGNTDARTDIYALGMTLYRLATGIDPVKNKVVHAFTDNDALNRIINRCIEPEAEKRYKNCLELKKALKRVVNSRGLFKQLFK